jgi:ammonia channel protein AmtB
MCGRGGVVPNWPHQDVWRHRLRRCASHLKVGVYLCMVFGVLLLLLLLLLSHVLGRWHCCAHVIWLRCVNCNSPGPLHAHTVHVHALLLLLLLLLLGRTGGTAMHVSSGYTTMVAALYLGPAIRYAWHLTNKTAAAAAAAAAARCACCAQVALSATTVVHMSSGYAALVAARYLGPVIRYAWHLANTTAAASTAAQVALSCTCPQATLRWLPPSTLAPP